MWSSCTHIRVIKTNNHNNAIISLAGVVSVQQYKELFHILATLKLKQEQTNDEAGGCRVRGGMLAQDFEKLAPDWCSLAILIDKCINNLSVTYTMSWGKVNEILHRKKDGDGYIYP